MYFVPHTAETTLDVPPGEAHDPHYRVVETLCEQGSGSINEDALAVADGLSIVCDGATSLAGTTYLNGGGLSGGKQAAAITSTLFSEHPGQDLLVSAHAANSMIKRAMIDYQVDLHDRTQLWSTSFAAVQVKGRLISWCQTGDCVILLVYEDGTSRRLTGLPGQDGEILKKWQRIGARTEGTIHQVMAKEIMAVRHTMNRNFGVLNGESEALDFLASGTVVDERIAHLLLFSDGLFPPSENPDNGFEEARFVDLYLDGGLQQVRDHVRMLQRQDPGCYRYPRFKKYDDISAIALRRT